MIKAACILTLTICAGLCLFGLWLDSDGTRFVWNQEIGPEETAEEFICVLCSATILGQVDGDVITVFGNQRIAGTVSGDVVAVGGDVTLEAGSRLGGEVLALGGIARVDPASLLSEAPESLPFLHFPGQRSLLHVGLALVLAAHLVGVLLAAVLLRPRRITGLTELMSRRAWTCFAVGFPMAAVWIHMDEWPEGPWLDWFAYVLSSVFAVLWTAGYTAFCQLLGRACQRRSRFWRQLIAGALLLFTLLAVPFVGAVLWAVISIAGLGAVFLAICRGLLNGTWLQGVRSAIRPYRFAKTVDINLEAGGDP